MNPDWLQYGALGLLGLVLVSGFVIAKNIFERMFEQTSENMRFVREQIEKADDRQAGQLKAWIDAHREQIVVGAAQGEAWGRVQETLSEMLKTLERLNGA